MNEKRITQIVIGIGFVIALLFTMLYVFVKEYFTGTSSNSPWWYYPAMFAFVLMSLVTVTDKHWALCLQIITMLAMSYVCLIVNGENDFYSWGFLLLSILMSWYYDLLQIHFRIKAICFMVSFFIASLISSYLHQNPTILSGNLIYFCCVFSFLALVFRGSLKKMLIRDKKMETLEAKLQRKEEELETALAKAAADIEDYNTTVSILQEKLKNSLDEYNQLKHHINSTIEAYNKRKEIIQNNYEEMKSEIHRLVPLKSATDLDYAILATFYMSKGSKTNEQIADSIDTSDARVKNHLHSIMAQLGVQSRSALYAYIADVISEESLTSI